jgi:hypothetical protein
LLREWFMEKESSNKQIMMSSREFGIKDFYLS